ncbi:oligosaccharide flippase family protein [Pleurocapsales cyanobacterium LEGE 06147]|nr:oligosaccharide flippase family protein [Pleurocapsales cyanobacterium LEGE 06147]
MFFNQLKLKINHFLKKSLVRNTLWELVAKFFTLAIQAAYFVIITRVLGTENYGSFIGITGLAAIAFPFTTVGSGHLLIQYVSRDRKLFSTYWGNALVIVSIVSFSLAILLFLLSPLIFPATIELSAIFMILVADLTGLAIFIVSAQAFMSVNLLQKSSLLQVFSSITKLIAAFILAIFVQRASLVSWSFLYLISAIITALISIFIVNKLLGKPKPSIPKIKSQIKEGVYFSIGESANNINTNIDKTMLASISTLEATGLYGAAYRFIQVGSVPISALLSASYPKFFQQGAFGINACVMLAKRLLPIVVIYGILSWIGYVLIAPWIPSILGEEYQTATTALLWLAPVTFIGALQQLLADTLTGAGFQKVRSSIQVVTAISNALLNLWLIPSYSWLGATWATLASESFRIVCLLLAVIFFSYQQKQSSS